MAFELVQYMDIIIAVGIIASSFIAAKLFYWFLRKFIFHLTAKTQTTLDDNIISAIKKPVYAIIIIAGAYAAMNVIQFLEPYRSLINQSYIVISVGLAAFIARNIADAFLKWYSEEMSGKTDTKFDDDFLPIFRKIIHAIIYAIAVMVLLGQLGVEITPLVASLGIGGLAVALALQDTLKSLFAGTYLISDKSIKPGDFIEIDDQIKGYVESIGWRSCKLKTLQGNLVIIPNNKLAESIMTNLFYPDKTISVPVECGVAYDSDLDRVEQVCIEVAKEVLQRVEGAVKDYEPLVRFKEFGDSNINFSVILRAEEPVKKFILRHEFIKALHRRFRQENIDISFPVVKVVK